MEKEYLFIQELENQIVEIPPDSIVSRTFFNGEETKTILFGFASGQELSEHTAARPAILHFIKGQASLTLGSDHFEVQEGAWVHMPPHLPHSILAKSKVLMLLYLL